MLHRLLQCSLPGTKLSICLCLMILISLHFYWTRTILPFFHIICGHNKFAMQRDPLILKNYEGHGQRPRKDGKNSLLNLKRQNWTQCLGFVKLHFTRYVCLLRVYQLELSSFNINRFHNIPLKHMWQLPLALLDIGVSCGQTQKKETHERSKQ